MSDTQRPVVETLIKHFRAQLDDKVRDQISNAQFSDLARMIDEAIDEEVVSAIDRVDEVVRKLRSGTRRAELEL